MHLVSRLLNTEALMDTVIQYVGPWVTWGWYNLRFHVTKVVDT